MLGTFTFNVVTAAIFTLPVFFFCSGFLQTIAFVNKEDRETMFSFKTIGGFYLRKLLRYAPLNIMAMLALLFLMPLMAEGPIWSNYQTMIEPCKTKWLLNVFWLNNLFPSGYDDKCLPWTWFIPCYIQLTLLIPPLMYIGVKGGKFGQVIIGGLALAFTFINFIIVYTQHLGASIVMNDEFYSKIFMMPYYHAPAFLMGILCALIYSDYLAERNQI